MTSHRNLAYTSGFIGLASLVAYFFLIIGEGNNSIGQAAPWVLLMGIPTGLAMWAAALEGSRARTTLLLSATAFAAIGIVAFFSIGVVLLGAGVVAAIAAAKASIADGVGGS